MKNFIWLVCVIAVTLSGQGPRRALADGGGLSYWKPGCNKVCCAEVVTKKETEHCWDVECKEVCIPPVRLPWFGSCLPLCGRVRAVNVLKKCEQEVEKKEIHWQVAPATVKRRVP